MDADQNIDRGWPRTPAGTGPSLEGLAAGWLLGVLTPRPDLPWSRVVAGVGEWLLPEAVGRVGMLAVVLGMWEPGDMGAGVDAAGGGALGADGGGGSSGSALPLPACRHNHRGWRNYESKFGQVDGVCTGFVAERVVQHVTDDSIFAANHKDRQQMPPTILPIKMRADGQAGQSTHDTDAGSPGAGAGAQQGGTMCRRKEHRPLACPTKSRAPHPPPPARIQLLVFSWAPDCKDCVLEGCAGIQLLEALNWQHRASKTQTCYAA